LLVTVVTGQRAGICQRQCFGLGYQCGQLPLFIDCQAPIVVPRHEIVETSPFGQDPPEAYLQRLDQIDRQTLASHKPLAGASRQAPAGRTAPGASTTAAALRPSPAPEATPAPAPALPPAPDATLASDAELFKLGKDLFKAGQYEEAAETLSKVNTAALPNAGRAQAIQTLADARKAAEQRIIARSEFLQGEEARRSNQSIMAATHYKVALANPYIDAETREKAAAQLAQIGTGEVPAAPAPGPTPLREPASAPTPSPKESPTGPSRE
jgi:hypothetical protein